MSNPSALGVAAALIAATIGAFTAIFAGLWAARRASAAAKKSPPVWNGRKSTL